MADVLVLMPNVVPTVPASPGRWEALMPVDVFPDGQLGPGTQQHPKFFIVRIPGVDPDLLRDVIDAIMDYDVVTGDHILVKRRQYQFDFNRLSTPIQNQILTNREIEVTESQFRSFLNSLA